MKFLVDTNVISEIRKGQRGHAKVMAWWDSIPVSELFISVLTLGEIHLGILKIKRRDMTQAENLRVWLEGLRRIFASRLVAVGPRVAMTWAEIQTARTFPLIDSLIAATAIANNFTLVTRTTKDMSDLGVKLLNPFKD